MNHRIVSIIKASTFIILFSISSIYAQNPIVKMDFDQVNRKETEVNQVGYTPWIVSGVNSDTKTENGVTFTVSKVGVFGDELNTSWYKTGIQAGSEGKLVNDGVTVKDGTAYDGGQIEFRISGLEAGTHTLLVFLNQTSNPNNTYSAIDISVDGLLVENNVIPTVRAANTAEAQSVYLSFLATPNTDVVILFAAETSGNEDRKNVLINGFELNTPNIFNQATEPNPADNNEHVELSSGNTTLSWTPAASAVTQHIYFGTNESAVGDANTLSSEYKGTQDPSDTTYQVNGLYTNETYYWRVDQISESGAVTKGNTWHFRPAILAFPQAEGYGRFARGGRGGQVVIVSNLNDSGSGSFREAITNDIGPRTIVFSVSGIIDLNSRLVLNDSYVTVAGQTAPGKGITIASAPFGVTGDDCVVQNIRVRLGGGTTFDGMGLTGAEYSIIDHCSISWTIDEAFSSRGGHNLTLQRTLISEALNAAGHQNYAAGTEHGYAASIGGNIGSYHHNLLAHNYGRNWSLAGGLDGSNYFAGKIDITNNVVYNWGKRTTDGGAMEVNFVNNYYKPGAGTTFFYALNVQHEDNFAGYQKYFFDGNVMPGYFDETNQEAGRKSTVSSGITIDYETFVDEPFFPSHVTTQSAGHAYKIVLSDVGCAQPVFDEHDQRMIAETLGGTYSVVGSYTGKSGFPDDEADSGGYEDYPEITRPNSWDSDNDGLPDWYESIIGTNINSPAGNFLDANADTDLNGYTNLDDYLQWMDSPNYSTATGETLEINIQELSRGFTSNVSYQISNVVNGTTHLNGDVLEFTPSATGLGSFEFTVTDSDDDSMTRTVNILNSYNLSLPVENINVSDVNVWPVPNSGTFSIEMKDNAVHSEFVLYDVLGQSILAGSIETARVKNVNVNARGVFVLKVLDSDTQQVLHTQKIVIE